MVEPWVQGTYITEEVWLLYPIFINFEFVIVSVDYRLAPEYTYPTYVDDCWNALQWTVKKVDELGADPGRIFLGGSSAGGCLAAVMAQKAREAQIQIKGVVLNVPVICHPRWFPKDEYEYTSYVQCAGTMLNGEEMEQVWDTACPDSERGKEADASPLLGDVKRSSAASSVYRGSGPGEGRGPCVCGEDGESWCQGKMAYIPVKHAYKNMGNKNNRDIFLSLEVI
jgi:acetyl esterase/lipase